MIDRQEAPLLDDYIFKRIFTRDNPNGILRDFLEAVLNIKIKNVQVLNTEIPKDLLEEKGNILDIRAELDSSKIVDIEMQVKNYGNIDKRSVTYMSKNISTQIKIGEDYAILKPSIVINIINFERYKRNSYHSVAHMRFDKTKAEEYIDLGYKEEEEIATDVLEMHFIELPKFIKKNPKAKTRLEQWLWLIAGKEEKLEMSKLDNPEVKKAMELVEEIMADPKERELYEARKMAKFNYDTAMAYANEKGMEEGINAGIRKERIKNAKKMKELKMSDEQICDILNINKEELKILLENK